MEKQDIIIYKSDDGKVSVMLLAKDGKAWMNQLQLSELFETSKPNISMHIANILDDGELAGSSVVEEYLTTGSDGKQYKVTFYSLEMILAIGFRVRGKRGTQFRQWANRNSTEFMQKGFVMDDERLKNPSGRPDYFDELLARIRDIRASELRFYQKLRDLFALSSDYDSTDKQTQMFFAEAQNKLLYAVTKQTAAELIVARADADKSNMSLSTWKGSVVRKQDIYIAKNYLLADELDSLNRLVVIFLETAELRVKDRKDIKIGFWIVNLDRLLEFNDKEVLRHKGSISKEDMKEFVNRVYEEFDSNRKTAAAEAADAQDLTELKKLEEVLKQRPQ